MIKTISKARSRRLIWKLLVALAISSLVVMLITIRLVFLVGEDIAVDNGNVFMLSASLLAASLFLLWVLDHKRMSLLFIILLVAFAIVGLYFDRFAFYGTDLVEEYFVANTTRELGRWMPERVTGGTTWLDWHINSKPEQQLSRYFSTLSVTVFPAIVSELTGLSASAVFWLLICGISTITVLVGFLIVRRLFGESVALLTSIIMVFLPFFLGKSGTILREDMAILFMLLAIYCLIRSGKPSYVLLSLIFLSIIPLFHYGIFYFTAIILFLLLLSRALYERKIFARILSRTRVTFANEQGDSFPAIKYPLIFFVIVGTCWLVTIAGPVFAANMQGIATSMRALIGLSSPMLSPFQRHLVSSSLGPFHTVIQWIERITSVLGFLLALRLCRTRKAFSFVFMGAGLLLLAFGLAVLPNLSLLFDLDRSMHVALLPFSFFIAIFIFSLSRKRIGKFLSIVFVCLFLLETLQTPILYSSKAALSPDQYIFSFTHTSFFTFSDFQFSSWMKQFTASNAVFVSDARGFSLCLICNRICMQPRGANASDTIALLHRSILDYFVFLAYSPDYLSFTLQNGTSIELNSTEINNLTQSPRLNRIYDNARVSNFAITP
jgi:hypothetical protein